MERKTYLVTGGTAGIGQATAQRLIAENHQVIITGRDQTKVKKISQELGCIGFVADSAQPAQLAHLAETLQNDNIKLDGLVLNAGVFYPDTFLGTTVESFNLTMDINTKGPMMTLQSLVPVLKNPSSVVFVSSIVVEKGFENCAVYSASKAAFESIARVANIELADKGIRINSVRPGITATEIQSKAGMTETDQTALFDTLGGTALGRVLTPNDLTGAIEFLLSDQSLALRNAAIKIDGGHLL